ncbi:MAG TPA: hypothetical protein VHL80_10990, partial [Polyangia bacterium]|nr:hypothetical protein [Polyangia bacterium]
MSGRVRFALGSGSIVATLLVGVAIGRSTKHEPPSEEPALASTKFSEELTDTTAVAPAPEPELPPVEVAAAPPEAAPAPPIVAPAP